MAEINLGNENEINVNISTDTNIGATVPDINYIPGYQIAEEERRANEVIRQSNEADRIALYEDMENKLATGYFDGVGLNYDWEGTSLGVKREDESEYSYTDLKGDTGNDGVSHSASVTRGTGSATITVTDASGTTTAVIYDGEKGDKGDKGDPGEVNIIVVEELPATGVEDTIYLVPLAEPDVQGNNYAEYIYINGAWELLGKVGIATDLTDYVKNTDYASLSKAGVVKTNSYSGFNVGNGGSALCDSVTYSQYEGRINDSFISKGTLENVITGKGLVSSSSLSTVATTGSYNDLLNKPTIPDELADLTDDSTHRLVTDADKTNWNNKVDANGEATTTSENTSFNLTNTLEAPLLMDLKGNTSQTGTPTPTSPIPVNVVSGDNEITISDGTETTTYNIDLPIENLLNNILTTQEVSGITFTKNTDGSVSISGTATANIIVQLTNNMKFLKVGNTYTLSGCASRGSLQTYRLFVRGTSIVEYGDGVTFTLQQSVFDSSNGIAIGITNGTNIQTPILFKPQIELGSKVNTFTPYGTTPIELNKIPNTNYEDRIFHAKDGDTYYDSLDSATKQTLIYDKWYLHKEVGKIILDGSESWAYLENTYFGLAMSASSLNGVPGTSNTYCDLFKYDENRSNLSYRTGNNAFIQITIQDIGTTSSAIKTWLSTHNTTIYYALATPTNTEITYTPLINQLNTLEQAQSYEGTTNINQVNNDLPFIIDATVFNDNYNGRYRSLKYMYDKISAGGSE